MAGSDMEKLKKMHRERGCIIDGDKDANKERINDIHNRCKQYECEIENFINIFFDRLFKNKYNWPNC